MVKTDSFSGGIDSDTEILGNAGGIDRNKTKKNRTVVVGPDMQVLHVTSLKKFPPARNHHNGPQEILILPLSPHVDILVAIALSSLTRGSMNSGSGVVTDTWRPQSASTFTNRSCLTFPFLRAAIGYRIEKPCKICNVWPRRNGYKLCSGNLCQYTSAHFPWFPLSGNAQSEDDDAHKSRKSLGEYFRKRSLREASRKEEELRRIEEKVRQSWEEAERIEAGARQMEYSAMVREAATHYKEVEVKHEMAEAKNARPIMSRSAKPKSIARRKMHGIGSLKPG